MFEQLSNDQVISILNRMDAEQRVFEQLNTARVHVRSVIQRFEEISVLLPNLEKQKIEIELSIGELSQRYQSLEVKLKKELSEGLIKLEKELEINVRALRETLSRDQKRFNVLHKNLFEKEERFAKREAELDVLIVNKEKALDEITTSFEEFKKQHGLGGGL